MNEIIYLDPDEEITSVIDKLKKSPSSMVSLAIPRGATLSQSIINLKLLRKSAAENDKEISLISNDRISRNLASQIGITVFTKVSEAEKATPKRKDEPASNPPTGGIPEGFSNIKVNSYYGNKDEDEDEDAEEEIEDKEETAEAEDEEEIVEAKGEKKPEKEEESEADDEEEPEHLEEKSDQKKEQYQPIKRGNYNAKKTKKILIGVAAAALIVVFALAYIFLPYATAAVQIKSTDYSLEKDVTVDPNLKSIDQEKLSIPGTVESVQKDLTKTFKATGQKKTPTEKAIGKITINYTWSNTAGMTFPAGTIFTSGGLSFVSQADVSVPKADSNIVQGKLVTTPGTADVSVQAQNAGDNYNIGPSTFTIGGLSALQQGYINGKSAAAMTGGVTQTANIVTDNDLKNASVDLEKDADTAVKPDLITKITNDKLKYYDETIVSQIISSSTTKNANDVADDFDCTIKISLSATAFSNDQLITLLTKSAGDGIGPDKMLISTDKVTITDILVKAHADTGTIDIKGGFDGKIGQKIALSDIQNLIKSKSTSEAKTLIEQNSSVTSATVKVWPKFISKVPFLKNRIKVTFDYAQQ